MKWNETEVLTHLSMRTPDWEGQLSYKAPKPSSTFYMQGQQFKERYLKLYGNILVISKGQRDEQTNVIILESFTVQIEDENIFTFSLTFQLQDCIEKHIFVAVNLRSMNQWLEAFRKASLEKMKEQLIHLQCRLKSRTGLDPLVGTNLELMNALYDVSSPDYNQLSASVNTNDTRSKPATKLCDHAGSSFTSHLGIELWEDSGTEKECQQCCSSRSVAKSKSSFKSHIVEENLIKF